MKYKFLPYNQSLALLTDLYELTMSYGYWKEGLMDKEAVFHLSFRRNPFQGGYAVFCGLSYVLDVLQNFEFDPSELEYLGTLKGTDEKALFPKEFLTYLGKMRFECDLDAMPEGTLAFPQEPLLRVQGPMIQAQLLESILLNIVNYQTLIATKAARVCWAAKGDPVLEFGLRRAHGFDGAIAASRAAYIGGCSATSNVLAGKMFGIPVRGTHAHSWVMCFDNEQAAFDAYARALPNNAYFLVDTYDTLEGVRHAIQTGKALKQKGYPLSGIRLDSGDLAYLSNEARKLLDEAGFEETKILASNDLDEEIISSLKEQGAKIAIWGVGTKLSTAYRDSALGGVYKLSAIRDKEKKWQHRLKVSEQFVKVSSPGILQVRRYSRNGENVADAIYDMETDMSKGCVIIDPHDPTRQREISADVHSRDLLIPIFKKGVCVYEDPSVEISRNQTMKSLAEFHNGMKRLVNPHGYPVGLESSLFELKRALVLKARKSKPKVYS